MSKISNNSSISRAEPHAAGAAFAVLTVALITTGCAPSAGTHTRTDTRTNTRHADTQPITAAPAARHTTESAPPIATVQDRGRSPEPRSRPTAIGTGSVAPKPEQDVQTPARQTSATRTGRPSWWIDRPILLAGEATVAAQGDGDTVLSARESALAAARAQIAGHWDPDRSWTPDESRTKVDIVRFADGTYRAFVLMTGVSAD